MELQTSSDALTGGLSFPPHVAKDWMTENSTLTDLKLALVPELSEEAIRERSKITPQELLQLRRLHNLEEAYRKNVQTEGEGFFKTEYERIRDDTTIADRTSQALALSIVAMETAYQQEGLTVWDTQRVALLRACESLQDDESKGLVINLQTGQGKSNVIIPTLLPVALLFRDQWHVRSLTPTSRSLLAQRFSKVGDLFDIPTWELTESTAKHYFHGNVTVADNQKWAFDKPIKPVLFTERQHLGFYLLKAPAAEVEALMVGASRRGRIADEVDASEIDDLVNTMVISGPQEPLATVITRYWTPIVQETEPTDTGEYTGRLAAHEFAWRQKQFFESLERSGDLAAARKLVGEERTTDTVVAVAILRKIFSFYPDLIGKDNGVPTNRRFLRNDGSIAFSGEHDIYRRLYQFAITGPDNPKRPAPNRWTEYFNSLIPAHVLSAVNTAIRLEGNFYVENGRIVVQSSQTGYPQKQREFSPLVMLALCCKESVNQDIQFPKTLHETTDVVSPVELDALLYDQTLGLTGTGVPASRFFRGVFGLDITETPPQFPHNLDVKNVYLPVATGSIPQRVKDFITELPHDDVPVLIDAPNITVAEDVAAALRDLAKESGKRVQVLSAKNADEAKHVFDQAGQKNTISPVVLMAGREVDIPVDEDVNREKGGLHILSLYPRTLLRNEIQLKGRTDRKGGGGVFRQLVPLEPNDAEVFRSLTDEEKTGYRRAVKRNDQRAIERWIRKGQEAHERRLNDMNEQVLAVYQPLVGIRQKLVSLPGPLRAAVQPVWKDFLQYALSVGEGAGWYPSFAILPRELRPAAVSRHLNKVFNELLALVPYSKYDQPLFLSRTRELLEAASRRIR